MAATPQEKIPQAWWFGSHYSSRQSPWLASALSELECKTKQMLNLVEADADSFAQRAEMYYKKRPLLLNMIEDFYRSHRSLAEQYDQLKSGGKIHRALFGPSSCLDRRWSQKVSNNSSDASSLFTSYSSDSDESEVDDPEQEETETEFTVTDESAKESESGLEKAVKGELARMNEENAALRAELAEKDEEKREVIRQLSSSIDILKEENSYLRKCAKGGPKKRNNLLEFKKLTKDILSGKVFGGHCKTQTTVVAL